MTTSQKSYSELTDTEKIKVINKKYHTEELTWAEVASELGVSKATIMRHAKRLGIKSRDSSAQQKLALKRGKAVHPTKGKKIDEATKLKMAESRQAWWNNLTEDQKNEYSKKQHDAFMSRPESERMEMSKKGSQATLLASKFGSKLEKFLAMGLIEKGYKVSLHKEHMFMREKLQVDIFLPEHNIAIEVDGEMHHSDIFNKGKAAFERQRKRDAEKDALLVSRGNVVIRIKNHKSSNKFMRDVLAHLSELLEKIQNENITRKVIKLEV